MAKTGRKSAASMEVVRLTDTIQTVHRPDAPYELTDTQSDIWRRIAEDLPADWFTPKNFDLLSQYCRHVDNGNRCAQLIEQEMRKRELDLGTYDKLLVMQEREGRALSSLATRMRLTQQSLYDKKLKLDAQKVAKPWEG